MRLRHVSSLLLSLLLPTATDLYAKSSRSARSKVLCTNPNSVAADEAHVAFEFPEEWTFEEIVMIVLDSLHKSDHPDAKKIDLNKKSSSYPGLPVFSYQTDADET